MRRQGGWSDPAIITGLLGVLLPAAAAIISAYLGHDSSPPSISEPNTSVISCASEQNGYAQLLKSFPDADIDLDDAVIEDRCNMEDFLDSIGAGRGGR